MIRHVVMWRLHEPGAGRSKAEVARELAAGLRALRGCVDGLLELDAGVNELEDPNSSDLVLLATFRDARALEAYLAHPLHRAVAGRLKPLRAERRVVDYTLPD